MNSSIWQETSKIEYFQKRKYCGRILQYMNFSIIDLGYSQYITYS